MGQIIKDRDGPLRIKILKVGETESFLKGKGTVKSGRDQKIIVADRGQV